MNRFLDTLGKKVIVLDGAMGTMIQGLNLSPLDFGGEKFQMLSDLLSFSRPEDLKNIHKAYFEAGADAVETNTFGASPLRLAEFDFKDLDVSTFKGIPEDVDLTKISLNEFCYHLSVAGCIIARQALEEYKESDTYDGRELFVVGSIGPSNHVLSSTEADLKQGTWEQIEDNFYQQVLGLIDGGADLLLFETQQDILELKAAVSGGFKAMEERGVKIPVMAQVTVDEFSRMQIFNTDILAALTTIQGIGIDVFGINCSTGPVQMKNTVKTLSRYSRLPISVLPNAGMPESENGTTVYRMTPEILSEHLKNYVSQDGINIVGGCCGTSPDHIRAIAAAVKDVTPAQRTPDKTIFLAGPQKAVPFDSSESLVRIGERLNVRGSKKVRDAVENQEQVIDLNALESVVSEQLNDLGVSILDVCMDSNVVDTKAVLPEVIKGVTSDFSGAMSLDSFDVAALGEAVKAYSGRPLINSISMEEYAPGLTRVDALLPVTKFHNPLYVALAAGPEGPALTASGKVDLAGQIIESCGKHGVTPDQILMDINAFPIGSESEEGMNFAMESLKSIPQIKALAEGVKTIIGVSNLTNGLAKKPYMRVVLTSIFLDEARKLGLDAAIVNPNHYVPVDSLDEADYLLGKDIIENRNMDAFAQLEEIALAKKGVAASRKKNYDDMEPQEAICEKILDGVKDRVSGTLEMDGYSFDYDDTIVDLAARAIKNVPPLTLINDYLMESMKTLGERFALGEVSLPHLLKSADIMKHVMGFLEKYMKLKNGTEDDGEIKSKGTIVLGTVYQDVHSIGKDLSKTLFENYGYRVIDLGVQVPLEQFIETAIREKADAIGMSALLVQTSNHMITVAQMMKESGLDIPILIGGAPVNNRHAGYVALRGEDAVERIKADVFYCGSAMDGVNIMESLNSERKMQYVEENRKTLINHLNASGNGVSMEELPYRKVDFSGHKIDSSELKTTSFSASAGEVVINEKALYALNWKVGKDYHEQKKNDFEQLRTVQDELVRVSEEQEWITPEGISGLFPCRSEGDTVIIYDREDKTAEIARISFSDIVSGDKSEKLCFSHFFSPADSKEMDVIGLQISTAGKNVTPTVEKFKEQNDTETAFLVQGLADRIAEDFAGFLHDDLKFKAGVSGKTGCRFSPGYSGLDVKVNHTIHKLLNAHETGIGITEAGEFSPTSTTAAIVCFHKDACYG